jgi:putative transposase
VDKHGQTIDFLLTEQRNEQAATRFLTKAIRRHGVPEKITIDICQVLHANRKPDF